MIRRGVLTPAQLRALGSVRPLAAAAVSLAAAQVVSTAIFTLTNVIVARALMPMEYGRVAFGLNLQMLLVTGAGLGLTTAVISEVARGRGHTTPPWSNVLSLLLVRLGSAGFVVAGSVVWSIESGDLLPALAGTGAAAFIIQDFIIGIFKGQLRVRPVAVVIVVQPIVYLALVTTLHLFAAEAVLGAFVTSLAFSLLLAVGAVTGLRPRWTPPALARPAQLREARRMATYAYALAFLQVAFNVLPIVLLGLFGRYAEAAELSVLIAIIRFLPELVGPVLGSVYFPRMRGLEVPAERERLFRWSFWTLAGTMLVPFLLLTLFGRPALHLVFAARYDQVADYLPIATPLILAMPIEALLTWTLLSSGAGRLAVIALSVRLAIALSAATAFVLLKAAGPFVLLVAGPVSGVMASLVVQTAAAGRRSARYRVAMDGTRDA